MRKMAILLVLVTAVFGLSGAMAHDGSGEAHRDCGTDPVTTDQESFIQVCIQDVGLVRLASDGNGGGYVAVDGAAEMGEDEGGPESWLDGYILITGNDEPNGNVYCAGNGAYEDGAQDDDAIFLNGGDCLNPGV
jgi:hypothetical protein